MEKDKIDEMMHGVEDEFEERPDAYDSLMRAADTPLYPGCATHNLLGSILKLFNLKAKHSWTNKSFTDLLELLGEFLPDGNELPTSYYEAQKIMSPMGMEYVKIHACPRDCVLFRKEHADLTHCQECGTSRYKLKADGSSLTKKPTPVKVLWHLPSIPRFRRLFSDEENAKLLRWHADGRKKDGLLRHPADAPQWRNFDRKYKDFRDEIQNLRLSLCTDGMNPFGTLSTQYSTWPVMLTVYNLPPWLCVNQRYIILSLLIYGPKQPENDLCVYLEPLLDELKLLWEDGVSMYDAYKKENFTLRAMLFFTINDFPAYGNLSGYTCKGKKACPVCIDDLEALRLEYSQKDVY